MRYMNIKCAVCGCREGTQLESHPADDSFFYCCDGCGSTLWDDGEPISDSDWHRVVVKRYEYDVEEG